MTIYPPQATCSHENVGLSSGHLLYFPLTEAGAVDNRQLLNYLNPPQLCGAAGGGRKLKSRSLGLTGSIQQYTNDVFVVVQEMRISLSFI
jgi:hypothetical protein